MKAAPVTNGALFVGLILSIFSSPVAHCMKSKWSLKEKQCKNAAPIKFNDSDRQRLYSKWHRIKCSSSFLRMSYGRIRKCSTWCQFFASRFNDEKLAERCSNKFRRQLSWFQITADSTNTSFVTRILVRRCRPFWRSVFIFKVVKCNCSGSTNTDVIDPCPIAIRLNSCQQLRDGSKQTWYRMGFMREKCSPQSRNISLKDQISCLRMRCLSTNNSRDFKISISTNNWPCISVLFKITECSCHSSGMAMMEALPDSEKSMVKFFNFIRTINLVKKNVIKDAVSAFKTTIQEFKNSSFRDYQMNIAQDEREGNAFFTTVAFEEVIIRYAEKQLNVTTPEIPIIDHDVNVGVRRVFNHTEREFRLYGTKRENLIKIPSANLHNGSVVLGVEYKNLYDLLITNHSADITTTNKTRVLNTIIMSAVIYPPPKELLENVTLVFKNIKVAGKNRQCVFWNFSEDNPEGWSGQGCQTKIINNSQTECVCNHLTHFAVLMDFTESGDSVPGQNQPSEEDDKTLTILTHVGMALSLTGVILTIISYLLLTDRHAPLSHIRVSLTTSIGAGHIIFLAGIDATENKLSVGCSSREFTSTCLLSRFTTSPTKKESIMSFPGDFLQLL